MKNWIVTLLCLCSLLSFAAQAGAYSVSWTTGSAIWVAEGSSSSNPDIGTLVAYEGVPQGIMSLYKNEILKESGDLKNSYWVSQLNFEAKKNDDDVYGLTISHKSDTDIVFSPYLLVKDGLSEPAWYFFNLDGWNGDDDLILSDFWTGESGSIGHVELFGFREAQVPIPATILLLGTGLLALVGFRRKVNS